MYFEFQFIHTKENNRQSRAILEDNAWHLDSQCGKLLNLFRQGRVLTTKQLVKEFDISDPRRRIKDLRDAGIEIKDRIVKGKFKEYFL